MAKRQRTIQSIQNVNISSVIKATNIHEDRLDQLRIDVTELQRSQAFISASRSTTTVN